jgi:hypothetical protein
MSTKKPPKKPLFFSCILCDYTSSKQKDFNRHLKTNKHFINTKSTPLSSQNAPALCILKDHLSSKNDDFSNQFSTGYFCENCNKMYKERSGLWRHKQKCKGEEVKVITDEIEDIKNSNQMINIVFELVKQNSEFKELLAEQNKYIVEQNQNLQNHFIELSKEKTFCNNSNSNNIITTNNNSNHFNLNLFLNETCKDAMNINEFVEQIPIYLSDLEDTARLGFAEGLSRIFIRGLKELDVNQRPIHCSDAKRETLYIKENDKWEKDDSNKSKLETAVRKVGSKNIRLIPEWRKQHPNCTDLDSNKNDLYLKIVGNSMCGGTVEETENNYNKIKKNIIKQVVIQK